jgi:hypothetical protein
VIAVSSDCGAGAGTTKVGSSKENSDAGGRKILARSHNVGVAPEIRIAPQKSFAAPSAKDDASVEKID